MEMETVTTVCDICRCPKFMCECDKSWKFFNKVIN